MFCMNCGAKLAENVKFCANCGTAILSNNTLETTLESNAPPHAATMAHAPQSPKSSVAKAKSWIPKVAVFAIFALLICGTVFGLLFFFLNIETSDNYELNDNYELIIAAKQMFEELILEMQMNDGVLSREQVIEILGDVYNEQRLRLTRSVILTFIVSPDINITATEDYFLAEGQVASIGLNLAPRLLLDETLVVDETLLRDFGENSFGLTYECFEAFFGRPGILTWYGFGNYMYTWASLDINISVIVDRYKIGTRIFVGGDDTCGIELHRISPDERDGIFEKFRELANEIDSNGYVSRQRLKDAFGEYIREDWDDEYTMRFIITPDLTVRAMTFFGGVTPRVDGIDSIHIDSFTFLFIDEDLVIDLDAIKAYEGRASQFPQGRPNLEYFEEMFGRPGVLMSYSPISGFKYRWVSRTYTVRIAADRYGEINTLYTSEHGFSDR